jgi:hypothetical protein
VYQNKTSEETNHTSMNFDNPLTQAMIPGTFRHGSGTIAFYSMTRNELSFLEFTPFNRTPTQAHARTLEPFIKNRIFNGVCVDTLKLCVLVDNIMNTPQGEKVKVYVADGQHRLLVMREMSKQYPCAFTFMAEVTIMQTETDIKKYVEELNYNLPQSTENLAGMSARVKLQEAMERIMRDAGEQTNRQCIRTIFMSRELYDGTPLSRALASLSVEDIADAIKRLGLKNRDAFKNTTVTSPTKRMVILRTRLYQLVHPSSVWLPELRRQIVSQRSSHVQSRPPKRSYPIDREQTSVKRGRFV